MLDFKTSKVISKKISLLPDRYYVTPSFLKVLSACQSFCIFAAGRLDLGR